MIYDFDYAGNVASIKRTLKFLRYDSRHFVSLKTTRLKVSRECWSRPDKLSPYEVESLLQDVQALGNACVPLPQPDLGWEDARRGIRLKMMPENKLFKANLLFTYFEHVEKTVQ